MIQRLFESAWVTSIAGQIVNTSKNDSTSKWSFDSFAALVEAVVAALNEIGYSLTSPSSARLKKLWERLHNDKPWLTENW